MADLLSTIGKRISELPELLVKLKDDAVTAVSQGAETYKVTMKQIKTYIDDNFNLRGIPRAPSSGVDVPNLPEHTPNMGIPAEQEYIAEILGRSQTSLPIMQTNIFEFIEEAVDPYRTASVQSTTRIWNLHLNAILPVSATGHVKALFSPCGVQTTATNPRIIGHDTVGIRYFQYNGDYPIHAVLRGSMQVLVRSHLHDETREFLQESRTGRLNLLLRIRPYDEIIDENAEAEVDEDGNPIKVTGHEVGSIIRLGRIRESVVRASQPITMSEDEDDYTGFGNVVNFDFCYPVYFERGVAYAFAIQMADPTPAGGAQYEGFYKFKVLSSNVSVDTQIAIE